MSDAFDVFQPFEPPEAAEERTAGSSAPEDPADRSSEPSREPRGARRWTAPAARPTPPPSARAAEAPLLTEADLGAFRAAALPELEAAVERLLARGHHASLADDLTQREPAVVVRFRPNQGPLEGFGTTAREPTGFELRLAADLDGETQVVAGYSKGTPDAPFTLLSRVPLSAVRGDWVAQRFVDFVRRALGLH